MRKILGLIFGVLIAVGHLGVRAAEFSYNGFVFSYEEGSDECALVSYVDESIKSLVIPDMAYDNGKEYVVTKLCRDAIECPGLVEITIGERIKVIDPEIIKTGKPTILYYNAENAEYGPNPNVMYSGIVPSSVTTIVIGDKVKYLPHYVFANMTYLSKVTFGKSVESIDVHAFLDCQSLTNIQFPESLREIQRGAFVGSGLQTVKIPKGLTYLGRDAFFGGVASVDYNAEDCNIDDTHQDSPFRGVKYAVICGDVIRVPSYAFAECNTLGQVSFAEGVETIGYESFKSCTSLQVVSLCETVKTIDYAAFQGCTSLRIVEIGKNVTTIAPMAFRGCTSLKEIYYNAADCKTGDLWGSPFPAALESVEIGENVRHIPDYAFGLCEALKPMVLPEGVESIGKQAYKNCLAMDSIVLPTTMTSLGEKAFEGCSHMKAVYSLSATPPAAYDNSFGCYGSATLYVPYGAGEAYRNAVCWGKFSRIVETDFAMLDKVYNSIETVTDNQNDGLKVTVNDRHVSVETPDGATVAIYSANGTEIYRGTDCKALPLMPGLYIVTCNGQSAKIAVR